MQNDVLHQEIDTTYLLPKPIKSLDDWKELFDDPNCSIYNEYGDEISKEDMIRIITTKNADNINARKPEQYVTILENENYDLILSGNDPAKGIVFC